MNGTLTRTSLIMAATLVLAISPLMADDWTQWRGQDRVGIWHETGIVEQLPERLAEWEEIESRR